MERLTVNQIAQAVEGQLVRPSSENLFVSSITIDSRKVVADSLFVAIKGENFDGHDYIEGAYNDGATVCVSERDIPQLQNIIVVKDTRKALLKLAAYYRRLFSTFVVGVTGSVGKTSTKEMINAVLSFKHKTLKTKGNLNNEIGLPLTIMGLEYSHAYAIIEMGMSNFDEIKELSIVAQPNVGVITNIGISHIEVLGSRENILKAKLEILEGMSNDAPLILNTDDDMLRSAAGYVERPIVTIGIDNYADISASNIEVSNWQTKFDINFFGKKISAVIPIMGKHNVYNALAAFAVGLMADIEAENIVKSFMLYQNASMRQEVSSKNGITSIKDCYNASPDSMIASLSVLNEFKTTGRKFAVLGDMLELGEISKEKHFEIGRYVGCSRIDNLICYGDLARHYKRGAVVVGMKEVCYFEDKEAIVNYLKTHLKPGDVVLYKASRGVKLEEVINLLDTGGFDD